MAAPDPEREEYLALVSEWSSYGKQSGSRVGNVYPVFSYTSARVVDKPLDEFPNPGAVFLLNRTAESWDFVRIRPIQNGRYTNASERDCYFICPQPFALEEGHTAKQEVAVLLDIPTFKPDEAGNIIKSPLQNATPLFFVRNMLQRIFGPLRRTRVQRTAMERLDSLHWAPWNEDGLVHEFTLEKLARFGVKLVTYHHPTPELNDVLRSPLQLLVGPVESVKSEQCHDRLPEAQLAEWYARWAQVPEFPADLLKAVRDAAPLAEVQPDLIRRRFDRLARVLTASELLHTERANLARRFLQSPEGQQVLTQELALEVDRRAQNLEAEVKKLQTRLADEEQRLAQELERLQGEYHRKLDEMTNSVHQLEDRRAGLVHEVEGLHAQLRAGAGELAEELRAKVPLFAALTAGLRTDVRLEHRPADVGTNNVARPSWGQVRVPAPTKVLEAPREEAQIIEILLADLADERLCFTREFLANLYVTLKASPLNLIIGPPGHGKSSVVAALARALGHGNSLLEIAVRRSWSDDRYLLGFYDTFHGRYDPGPTGLATRLLQAQRDWEAEQRGLYFILLDEFNLAAPEYYFSQLLQVVTRTSGPRTLQLFDPSALPSDGVGPVHQIALNPNVSFWGTINYDETTERLSPRVLDRTGMVFLTARDVLPSHAALAADSKRKGVSAATLCQRFQKTQEDCPDEHWELLQPLFQLLRQQSEDWGPGLDLSPRVILGIKRYLANSVGILPALRAVDFAFEQRVLPLLAGRGAPFTSRVKALLEALTSGGLERSARHVRAALDLAELSFGDIDFFAYQ